MRSISLFGSFSDLPGLIVSSLYSLLCVSLVSLVLGREFLKYVEPMSLSSFAEGLCAYVGTSSTL